MVDRSREKINAKSPRSIQVTHRYRLDDLLRWVEADDELSDRIRKEVCRCRQAPLLRHLYPSLRYAGTQVLISGGDFLAALRVVESLRSGEHADEQ